MLGRVKNSYRTTSHILQINNKPLNATEKHATLCLHNIAPCSLQREINTQITVAPLKGFKLTIIFVVSYRKLPSYESLHMLYTYSICTNYIAMFRFLMKRKARVCMYYAHASMFTRKVMRNVTVSSTMGTLCYEL